MYPQVLPKKIHPLPIYPFILIFTGYTLWCIPFLLLKRKSYASPPTTPKTLDRRARWGVLLQAISYALLWQGPFWTYVPQLWLYVLSATLYLLAALLSFTATRALGTQWRIDATLNPGHQLIRTGPYRFVRHPIYTSMLSLLLATGTLIAPWPLLAASTILFILGTEIRVRLEERLLKSQFGDTFKGYQQQVGAYVPRLTRARANLAKQSP